MGLGIGAIAEVAKQSLGGKRKGGKDVFFFTSPAVLSFHSVNEPLVAHTWQIPQTDGRLVNPETFLMCQHLLGSGQALHQIC